MADEQETETGLPDLRLPVGLFFIIAGVVLLAEGALGHTTAGDTGINIDLDWGGVLLLFGALMAFFGWRAGPEIITEEEKKAAEDMADQSGR